jgi:hypothetical protein
MNYLCPIPYFCLIHSVIPAVPKILRDVRAKDGFIRSQGKAIVCVALKIMRGNWGWGPEQRYAFGARHWRSSDRKTAKWIA